MQSKSTVLLTIMFLVPTLAALAPPVVATPPADCVNSDLDVLFVMDTTGSMGGVLDSVKDEASNIMSAVLADVPNAQFGAAHYEDYPDTYPTSRGMITYGGSTDLPWNLVQTITSNTNSVDSAIQGIGLGGGSDGPESLVRALHESHQSSVGWRTGSMRLVILFTDAPGHDEDFAGADTGGDPGPDGIMGNSDDLDFQTVVQDMANADTHVIAIQSGSYGLTTDVLEYVAEETDGMHVPLAGAPDGDLGAYIRDLILAMAPQTAMSEAYNLYVGLNLPNVPATVLVDRLNLQQAPSGGTNDQVDAIFTLGLITGQTLRVELGVLHSEATGEILSHRSDAYANAAIEHLRIDLGSTKLLEANTIESWAKVTSMVASTARSGQTEVAFVDSDLFSAASINIQNQVVPLINGGSLVLGEKLTGATASGGWVESNAIHLTVPLVNGISLEVIVGHAFAGATCQDERTWTWTPPTDDPAVPWCVLEPAVEQTAGRAPGVGGVLSDVLGQWDGVEVHMCNPCPTDMDLVETDTIIRGVETPDCSPCPELPTKGLDAIRRLADVPDPCEDDPPGQPPVCNDPLVSSILQKPTCVEWPTIPKYCERFLDNPNTSDLKDCITTLSL